MSLTAAQQATLEASINSNTNLIPAGIGTSAFTGMAINAIPQGNNFDGALTVAAWYNLVASPAFWVWETSKSRSDIYTIISDLATPTAWNWTTFQQQSATQQTSWKEMFMGDKCNFALLNNRSGVNAIFGNTGTGLTQKNHVFAVSRRKATICEKLFAAAVVAVGGLTVDATTGNTTTDPLGGTTNPAVMGFEGQLQTQDILDIWNP